MTFPDHITTIVKAVNDPDSQLIERRLVACIRFIRLTWRMLVFVCLLAFTVWKYDCAFSTSSPYFWSWFAYATVSLVMTLWFGWKLWSKREYLAGYSGELIIATSGPQLLLGLCGPFLNTTFVVSSLLTLAYGLWLKRTSDADEARDRAGELGTADALNRRA